MVHIARMGGQVQGVYMAS